MELTICYDDLLRYNACEKGRLWFLEHYGKEEQVDFYEVRKSAPKEYKLWLDGIIDKVKYNCEKACRIQKYSMCVNMNRVCDCLSNGNEIYYDPDRGKFHLVNGKFEEIIDEGEFIKLLQQLQIIQSISSRFSHPANAYYVWCFVKSKYDYNKGEKDRIYVSQQMGYDGAHMYHDKEQYDDSSTFNLIRPKILLDYLLSDNLLSDRRQVC
jgi:hypothetical protein